MKKEKIKGIIILAVAVIFSIFIFSAEPGETEKSSSLSLYEAGAESMESMEFAESLPEQRAEEVPVETAGEGKIYVHVCGQVNSPGVYELEPGTRAFQAVDVAGGVTAEANASAINMASELADGSMLYVPAIGELDIPEGAEGIASEQTQGGRDLININTATKEQLMELSGIGESKAESIIAYREEKGGFKTCEELKQVSGIGDGIYEKLKSSICVN